MSELRGKSNPVDPFVFVAATRYAIRRWLTDASELVARQVFLHADAIRLERGAASAIAREVDDFLREGFPEDQRIGTRGEWDRVAGLWVRATGELAQLGHAAPSGAPPAASAARSGERPAQSS
jgi:hypothetical protein